MLETLAYVSISNLTVLTSKVLEVSLFSYHGTLLDQFPLLLWLLYWFLAQKEFLTLKTQHLLQFLLILNHSILIPWFQVPVIGEYWNQKQVMRARVLSPMQDQEKFTRSVQGWGTRNKGTCKSHVPQSLGKQQGSLQLPGPTGGKEKKLGMGLNIHCLPNSGGTENNIMNTMYTRDSCKKTQNFYFVEVPLSNHFTFSSRGSFSPEP